MRLIPISRPDRECASDALESVRRRSKRGLARFREDDVIRVNGDLQLDLKKIGDSKETGDTHEKY
jgi:hypothetical protein